MIQKTKKHGNGGPSIPSGFQEKSQGNMESPLRSFGVTQTRRAVFPATPERGVGARNKLCVYSLWPGCCSVRLFELSHFNMH